MSKENYIYSSKIIEIMFFSFLILIASLRLNIGLGGVWVVEYFFDGPQFLFIPVTVSVMLYRVDRYYQNIFCRIRYRNQKQWKWQLFKDSLISIVFVVGLFYLIVFVCCFMMEIEYFAYILILFIHTCLVFLFMAYLNIRFVIQGKQHMVSLFCIGISVSYVFLLRFLPPFYSFYDDFMGKNAKIFCLITLMWAVADILLLTAEFKGVELNKIGKRGAILVFMVLLFVFQNAVYQNFYAQESLGFPDIFFITINEILMPLFLWISNVLLLISITLYVMFTNYRSHLLFYAIRIQNRTVWFLKTFGKGTLILAVILTMKYGINELFRNQTMSYVMYMIEGVLRIQVFSLFMFLLYQIYKSEKLFSYGLIAFVVLAMFSVTTATGANLILMRVHNMEVILLMAVVAAGMLGANCYAINHLDYY